MLAAPLATSEPPVRGLEAAGDAAEEAGVEDEVELSVEPDVRVLELPAEVAGETPGPVPAGTAAVVAFAAMGKGVMALEAAATEDMAEAAWDSITEAAERAGATGVTGVMTTEAPEVGRQ